MADEKKKAGSDQSSAHPPDWPGIPGRSAEHENSPGGERHGKSDSQSTEAQRELEHPDGPARH